MLTLLIIIIVLMVLFGGGLNYGRHGPVAFSPLGLILVGLIILWLTGAVRF